MVIKKELLIYSSSFLSNYFNEFLINLYSYLCYTLRCFKQYITLYCEKQCNIFRKNAFGKSILFKKIYTITKISAILINFYVFTIT